MRKANENNLTNVNYDEKIKIDNNSESLLQSSKQSHPGKTVRRARVPLHLQTRVIKIPNQDPDYHYVFVTDDPDYPVKIESYIDAGYEFVDSTGREITPDERIQDPLWKQRVISQKDKQYTQYCMRVPKKEWEEDQIAKSEISKRKVTALKDNTAGNEIIVKEATVSRSIIR